MSISVRAIHISSGGIPKLPIAAADVTVDGFIGDAHDHEKHNTPMQALCLFDVEGIEELCAEGYELVPGALGENVTLEGVDVDSLEIGDRLRFSGGVVAEITKRRKPCYVLDAIDPSLKKAMIDRAGVYAKVLTPGKMRPGEHVEVLRAAAETR